MSAGIAQDRARIVRWQGYGVCLALLAFSLVGGHGALYAQGTADIVGAVTDSTGAVVPNATVTAKNAATNLTRTVQTTSVGAYSLNLLPVGAYSVSVEAM